MFNLRNRVLNGQCAALPVSAGLIAAAALFLHGCGSEKKETSSTPAAPAVTYADVSSIVKTNCVSCHGATGPNSPNLSTESALNSAKTTVLAAIAKIPKESKFMPPSQSGTTAWNTTTDGAKLKTYLESVK